MPTYEYECTRCGHTFEEFQAITDRPRTRCPACRGRVQKLISGGLGVVFKGEGFYVNDSRRTGRSPAPAVAAGDGESSASSSGSSAGGQTARDGGATAGAGAGQGGDAS